MPQRINIPGIGIVNFPDGMTDEQIGAAVDQMQAEQKEKPLTLEKAPAPSARDILNSAWAGEQDKKAKNQAFLTEHLPTIGGIVGGLAAAPLTGGMTALPALATAAGAAGLGGFVGSLAQEDVRELQGVDFGKSAFDAPREGAIQGVSQLAGGLLSKGVGLGLRKGGEALYGLALRPEINALAAKFPGVTRQGLAQEGIRQAANISERGAATAGQTVRAAETAVDKTVARLPKGTLLPTRPVTSVAGAAKPVIKEAQARAAGNASVKPVFRHVKNAGASHAAQISPQEMLALQRATARQAGSAAGVMPAAARPTAGNMGPNLIPEANRAMAGGAQDAIEAAAPSIAPIQAQLPMQNALAEAIQAATQRPLLSQYMTTGAVAPLGGATLGGLAGGYASGGDPYAGLAGAASGALLANPRTLSNLAILAGRSGNVLSNTLGQVPATGIRAATDLARSEPDFSDVLEVPPPSPIDMTTGMRLIPREDYWTPR
jgi:hypothetical protein